MNRVAVCRRMDVVRRATNISSSSRTLSTTKSCAWRDKKGRHSFWTARPENVAADMENMRELVSTWWQPIILNNNKVEQGSGKGWIQPFSSTDSCIRNYPRHRYPSPDIPMAGYRLRRIFPSPDFFTTFAGYHLRRLFPSPDFFKKRIYASLIILNNVFGLSRVHRRGQNKKIIIN